MAFRRFYGTLFFNGIYRRFFFRTVFCTRYLVLIFGLILFIQNYCYAVGGPGIVATSEVGDADYDGIDDDQDAFPDDPTEWIDTDSDGVGNNSDTDDDNDGMPDNWEAVYNLNPLVNDAEEDSDEDGFTNLEEFIEGTDPTQSSDPQEDPEYNNPPDPPELDFPGHGSITLSLQPELQTKGFGDSDTGDAHIMTQWQISPEFDFSSLVYEQRCNNCLESLIVSGGVLKQGSLYFWRVRFYDNHHAVSEWSEVFMFSTQKDIIEDNNANGVPDAQEVDETVDLDNDGTPDLEQDNILSLHNTALEIQLGIKGFSNIAEAESAAFVDQDEVMEVENDSGRMPFGLINFRLRTVNLGDTATVKVYFSETVPDGASWYKYDDVSGLVDYSDHAFFSADRRSIVLEFKDGGFGDADGTENGVIVDPGGVWIPTEGSESEGEDDNNDEEILKANASLDVTGCFIDTTDSGLTIIGGIMILAQILSITMYMRWRNMIK